MSGQAETGREGRKMRGGLRILLFASLALNLLIAGLVVGAVASHRWRDDGGREARIERPGGLLAAALSREDKRAIGRAMREEERGRRPDRAAFRAEIEGVIAALEAEPYDAAAVRAVIDRQADLLIGRARLGGEMLIQRLEAMSAAERADYAERLREMLERRWKKGDDRKDSDRHD